MLERKDKTQEMLKIINIPEEELEKLSYKEKQKYYKYKNKFGKMVHNSKDKNRKGVTYRKVV